MREGGVGFYFQRKVDHHSKKVIKKSQSTRGTHETVHLVLSEMFPV